MVPETGAKDFYSSGLCEELETVEVKNLSVAEMAVFQSKQNVLLELGVLDMLVKVIMIKPSSTKDDLQDVALEGNHEMSLLDK